MSNILSESLPEIFCVWSKVSLVSCKFNFNQICCYKNVQPIVLIFRTNILKVQVENKVMYHKIFNKIKRNFYPNWTTLNNAMKYIIALKFLLHREWYDAFSGFLLHIKYNTRYAVHCLVMRCCSVFVPRVPTGLKRRWKSWVSANCARAQSNNITITLYNPVAYWQPKFVYHTCDVQKSSTSSNQAENKSFRAVMSDVNYNTSIMQ